MHWRGDIGGFCPTVSCPDGVVHDIDLQGIDEERKILIDAIDYWLRRGLDDSTIV
jgi:hypothetical protein